MESANACAVLSVSSLERICLIAELLSCSGWLLHLAAQDGLGEAALHFAPESAHFIVVTFALLQLLVLIFRFGGGGDFLVAGFLLGGAVDLILLGPVCLFPIDRAFAFARRALGLVGAFSFRTEKFTVSVQSWTMLFSSEL